MRTRRKRLNGIYGQWFHRRSENIRAFRTNLKIITDQRKQWKGKMRKGKKRKKDF